MSAKKPQHVSNPSRRDVMTAISLIPNVGYAKPAEDSTHGFPFVPTMHDLPRCIPSSAIFVLGFNEPGDGGGGLFMWDDSPDLADIDGITVRSAVRTGHWRRGIEGPLDVRWFGAIPDKEEDSSQGIQAAIEFARQQQPPIDVYIPSGRFHVDHTIIIRGPLRKIRGEGRLVGRIRSYPPIVGPCAKNTSYPGEDAAGHLSGSCFYFVDLIYYIEIRGLTFENFRFALTWLTAHNSPRIIDCSFEYCNVALLFYQGSQFAKIIDCGAFHTGVLVVGAATCFDNEHPLKGLDNYYCDGLTVSNTSQNRRHYLDVQQHFDEWYRESILRPQTPSITINRPNGVVYPHGGDDFVCNATGRLVFLPFRNPRPCFSLLLRDIELGIAWRGVACVNTTLISALFVNITSEALLSGTPLPITEHSLFQLADDGVGPPGNTMINCGVGIDFPKAQLIRWVNSPRSANWVLINCWPGTGAQSPTRVKTL